MQQGPDTDAGKSEMSASPSRIDGAEQPEEAASLPPFDPSVVSLRHGTYWSRRQRAFNALKTKGVVETFDFKGEVEFKSRRGASAKDIIETNTGSFVILTKGKQEHYTIELKLRAKSIFGPKESVEVGELDRRLVRRLHDFAVKQSREISPGEGQEQERSSLKELAARVQAELKGLPESPSS